jgi:O-methyltransferase
VTSASASDLYLDLMAKILTRYGFEGHSSTIKLPGNTYGGYLFRLLVKALRRDDVRLVGESEFQADLRLDGRDWPAGAESMIGLKRMANIRECVEQVIADGVPGDLIETGVWRGGSTIYMRAILKAHDVTDRVVWVADSFEGLPEYDGRYDADIGDQLYAAPELAISLEQVQDNFRRYDLLDDQVRFLKGWFSDTLPDAPIESLAVLRLDGDLYASTMDALDALYHRVSPGGFVIVDDYVAVPACAKAIHDFRDRHGITDPLETVDWTCVYWRKTA